ncbi:MAG: (d)CMP kinase [Phycisphaerales bacterium]|nr:MAG: (d)CMP kinase [Phycisphaerales bacterium]
MIVTIDGPAASGKSTVARLLAEKLGASFLDTGAMYRAVTLAAMQAGVDLNDQQELLNVAQKCELGFSVELDQTKVLLNDVDVTEQIRDPEVTANARYIAGAPDVRAELVRMQRQFAADREKVVTEGRDQGTVAFADADVKLFLTADPAERARRRQADLKAKSHKPRVEDVPPSNRGQSLPQAIRGDGRDTKDDGQSLEQIQRTIEERDKSDRSRAVGPLKPAEDAVVIDTTALTIDEVVEKLLMLVKERCSKNS